MKEKQKVTVVAVREVFCVVNCTKDSEGKASFFPRVICEMRETAERLAKNKGINGPDAVVEVADVIKVLGVEYIPLKCVTVTHPIKSDLITKKRQEVLKRAKASGLSDTDINILMNMKVKES